MKVLSLFDGISCGRLALKHKGQDQRAYYMGVLKYRKLTPLGCWGVSRETK